MARPSYQVLIHDMPLTFDPENPEQIMELQKTNTLYIQGITIQKAAWLKRSKTPNKTSGSLIVWFDGAEQADIAISKGVMWKCDLKATEIFRSGFRLTQCFNCQKYGHIAKICTAGPKCEQCAGGHDTRTCSRNQETRCSNYSRKHTAWDQMCPVRLAAKSKVVKNRTQDPGRFTTQETQVGNPDSEWQIIGSRKRTAGLSTIEIAKPVGEGNTRRGPGRPRKAPSFAIQDTSNTIADLTTIASIPIAFTHSDTRTVTRDNDMVATEAPESEMAS